MSNILLLFCPSALILAALHIKCVNTCSQAMPHLWVNCCHHALSCLQLWAQFSEKHFANILQKESNFLPKKFSQRKILKEKNLKERAESCLLTVCNITLGVVFMYLEVFTEVLFSTSVQCLCLHFFKGHSVICSLHFSSFKGEKWGLLSCLVKDESRLTLE